MKKILIVLFFVIILIGCTSKDSSLEEVMKTNNYIIVDVREKEEYDLGHIKGAINIPYHTIDENVELDRSKTILVYCKSGKRSSIAYNSLKGLGYEALDLGSYDSINLEKE